QRRMKQAGMRWSENNLNPMLALRTALCNQRWSETWMQISAHRRAFKKKPFPSQINNTVDASIVSEEDVQKLENLAKKLEKKGWTDHRWIFPHRPHFSHQN
ncbi:MAG: hypothetical protein ACI9EW_001034, partial [Cellvibrionaceae bacterium]